MAIEWDVQIAGAPAFADQGRAVPPALVDSVRERGTALKGPLAASTDGAYRSPTIALRDALGIYAGIRPCRALAGVQTAFPGTNLVVVRMTGEDLYAGIEFAPGSSVGEAIKALLSDRAGVALGEDVGVGVKPISRSASTRVVRLAFEYAARHRRTRVTAVHKATVMRHTDGLFLAAAREIAEGYPDIDFDDQLVDAVCHHLVTRPTDYDVLVMPMMYGDIVSDIGAGLIGGLGMAPGVNLGDDCAVFEAVHGTAPRHTGADRVNPLAAILSGAMLLDHLGEERAARRLESAVEAVVRSGETVTYDLTPGRSDVSASSTSEAADTVIAALNQTG